MLDTYSLIVSIAPSLCRFHCENQLEHFPRPGRISARPRLTNSMQGLKQSRIAKRWRGDLPNFLPVISSRNGGQHDQALLKWFALGALTLSKHRYTVAPAQTMSILDLSRQALHASGSQCPSSPHLLCCSASGCCPSDLLFQTPHMLPAEEDLASSDTLHRGWKKVGQDASRNLVSLHSHKWIKRFCHL